MKLLAIAPVPFLIQRGNPLRVLAQLRRMDKAGWIVDVVTYPIGVSVDDLERVTLHRAPFRCGYTSIPTGPSRAKVLYDLQMIVMVCARLITHNYNIVYAYNYEGIAIAGIVRTVLFWKKIKIIADIQGVFAQEMEVLGNIKGAHFKNFFSWIEKLLYLIPDAFIASSPVVQELIVREYPSREVLVSGDEILRSDITTQEGGLDSVLEKRIVYTGGFTRDKGVELLLDAFANSYFSQTQARLILAGGPVHDFEDKLAQHPHRDRIRVIENPNTRMVDAILSGAYIACEPKYISTGQSSGKLARYLAHGIPIVACDTPANRYYLSDQYQFISTDQPSLIADQFTAKLRLLLEDQDYYNTTKQMVIERQEVFESRAGNDQLIAFIKKHA